MRYVKAFGMAVLADLVGCGRGQLVYGYVPKQSVAGSGTSQQS